MPPRPFVHSVRSAFAFGVVAAILLSNSARAQTAESTLPSGPEAGEPSFFTGLWTRSNLLGDMGGLRSTLGRYGLTLNLQETSEVFGNVSGGIRRGAAYDGLTQMSLALDTAKAFGWEGGT